MPANWVKEQLETARNEIKKWPDWKRRELDAETEQIPRKVSEDGKARPTEKQP